MLRGGGNVIIGTDGKIDHIKSGTHENPAQILDTFVSGGFIPTMARLNRITQTTSALIDNILISVTLGQTCVSCSKISDISDY